MAEGFARHFFGGHAEVFSAGSSPAGFVAPLAIQVMAEVGIDISRQWSKSLKEVPQGPYDLVVTMGCGDACPWIPAKHRLDWFIDDPFGKDIDAYRKARDEIEVRVRALSGILGCPASDQQNSPQDPS